MRDALNDKDKEIAVLNARAEKYDAINESSIKRDEETQARKDKGDQCANVNI